MIGPNRKLAVLAVIVGTLLLGACVRMNIPENHDVQFYGPEKTALTDQIAQDNLTYPSNTCPPPGTPNYLTAGNPSKTHHRPRMQPMRYSPGDRINLLILGSPEFSGDYAVNVDGTINLPYAGPIQAAGLTNKQLSDRIRRRLLRQKLFTTGAGQISVHPVQYAAVNITISGAVFKPGRYTINVVLQKNKQATFRPKTGDNPLDRFVPAAINAANGVRPDADLTNIAVHRNGKIHRLDWRGAVTGHPVDDMPLIAGDHVQVGASDCFQSGLIRSSQITPQSIRVFISNLTVSGANSISPVPNPVLSGGMPYGSRLLQALVHAHCVGGSYATNAKRVAVLITRNPKTHKTEVIQRSVEDLVRSADRDKINPFLMPEDAIACYDSDIVEFRDVMTSIYSTVIPPGIFDKL